MGGWGRAAVGTAAQLTISVHTHDEVVTHGPGLAQLVGVAIMYHVVAVESTGLSFPCWGSALFLCSVIRKPAKKPPRELPPGSQLGFQCNKCLSSFIWHILRGKTKTVSARSFNKLCPILQPYGL